MYCYLEFKFRYLKNLKIFSIRVEEFFEPIDLRKKKKKKKADGFLLFFSFFRSLFFLKAFSGETDL